MLSFLSAVVAARPAGGAALGQVALATSFATVATGLLLWLMQTYRSGSNRVLERASAFSQRVSALPGWAARPPRARRRAPARGAGAASPAGVAGGSLGIALLGMYWDISLHIDNGRDPGPLANPAHYLILVGLYGVLVAGVFSMVMSGTERPTQTAIHIGGDWWIPAGGLMMTACGAFALSGFPLDDIWHRLFGQDVTLWGPTHLMLIGGAAMTLVGIAVLAVEGLRANRAAGEPDRAKPWVKLAMAVALTGGFMLGLSTFQAEFDFGVPQFRLIFHPI